jgi:quinol monooxygenase YgiN
VSPSNLIQCYIEAWNQPDAELATVVDPGLQFRQPGMPAPGNADSLAEAIQSLHAVLPGVRIEPLHTWFLDGSAGVRWHLTGTNSAPWRPGFEPTQQCVSLEGMDVLTLAGVNETLRIQSIERFFDRQSLHEGIGLQVIVQPYSQGNTTFGYSKRVVSGNPALPAVIGLTWIRFRGPEELDRIRQHSAQIIPEFLEEPGFLSIVTGAAGTRAFTVTAWESEEAMHRALAKAHSRAMRDFRETDLAPAVWTSVWKPVRTNRIWTRCPACGKPNDVTDNHWECLQCRAVLPERELFW